MEWFTRVCLRGLVDRVIYIGVRLQAGTVLTSSENFIFLRELFGYMELVVLLHALTVAGFSANHFWSRHNILHTSCHSICQFPSVI
jgi:hypothetical protein